MYSAVAARTREIATLRALGFGASAGGPLGDARIAGAGAGRRRRWRRGRPTSPSTASSASTINWQTFSQVAFAFAVTPQLLVQAILWAVVIGLLGGLFPAIRAARLPIAAALRES